MTITADEIEKQGFAKTGDFGGQPKTTYWTPDGRMIRAPQDIHEYAKRDDKGKVIESGTRDANFDKGWLPMKPQVLQLYCPHCDRWHKTKGEVDACGKTKAALIAKHTRLSRKQLKVGDDTRITKLESDMTEIKGMFKKLMEKM